MTFTELFTGKLEENGMFPIDAQRVIARLQGQAEDPKDMCGRWSDDTSGYPTQVLAVLWMTVKREALKYIDETCPKAWYRSLLEV